MLENYYPVYYLPGPIPPYSNQTNPSDTLNQIRDQFSIPLTKKFYTLKLIDDENQNLSQIFNYTECSGLIIANISNNFLNTQKVEIENKTDKYQIHFIDRIGSHEFDLEFKNTDNLNSKILEIIKICNFGQHQLEFILSGTILDAGECIYSIMQRNRCNRPIYVFETTKKLNIDEIAVIHETEDIQEKIEDKSEIPDNGKIHLKLHSLVDGDNHYNIDFDPNTPFDKVIDQLIKFHLSLQEIEVGFMDIDHHRIDIYDRVDDYNNKDIFFGNADEMFTGELSLVDLTSRLAESAPEPTNTITMRSIEQRINVTSNDFIPEKPNNKEEKPTEESNSTTTDIKAPISDKIEENNAEKATKESNSTTTDIRAPINDKSVENNTEKATEVKQDFQQLESIPKGVIRLIDIDNQKQVTEFLIDETTTFENLISKLYVESFDSALIVFRDLDWNQIHNEDNASQYESSYAYWGLNRSDNWSEKPSSIQSDLEVVNTFDLRNNKTQENSIQTDEPVKDTSTTIMSTHLENSIIEINQLEDMHEEVSTPATIMSSQPENSVIEIALQQLGHSEIAWKSFHKNADFNDVTSNLVNADVNLEEFALTYMTEKGKIIGENELVRDYISEKIIWENEDKITIESDKILAEQKPQKPIESPVTEIEAAPASYDSNIIQSPQNEYITAFAEPPSYIQDNLEPPSTKSTQFLEDKVISTENISSDDMIVTIKACRSFSNTNASTPIEIKLPSTANISDLRNALMQQNPDFGKDYIEFRDEEGVKYSDNESIELITRTNRGIFILLPQTVKTVIVTFEGWKTFEVEETPRDKIPNMLKIIGDVNITYDPSLEKIEADESITECKAKIDNGVIVIANVDGKPVGDVILASDHQFKAIISELSNNISEIRYPFVYDENGNDIHYQTPKDTKLDSPIKVNIGEDYHNSQGSEIDSQDFEEKLKTLMEFVGYEHSEDLLRSILQAYDGDIEKAIAKIIPDNMG